MFGADKERERWGEEGENELFVSGRSYEVEMITLRINAGFDTHIVCVQWLCFILFSFEYRTNQSVSHSRTLSVDI